MQLVFDYKNTNVKYISNKDINDSMYNKKLLIYPAFEYKIFAPVFDDIKLNIFQKTVLSILNKGKYDVDDISRYLCMDRLLVQTILAELQNKGLFESSKGNITQEGKDLSNGTFSWFANSENLKKDIRYIYQDLYTHNIYPVLIDKENYQKDIYFKDKKLNIFTKGKRESFDYIQIEPNKEVLKYVPSLENKEIFKAINKHANTYIDGENNIDNSPEAIQILSNEPTLIYIATWIYINKDNHNLDEFEVLDPFDIYEDGYWLKENLEVASKSNNRLNDTIESLVIDAQQKEQEQKNEIYRKNDFDTLKYLDNTFDSRLKDYSSLYDGLKSYFKYFIQYDSQSKENKDIQLIKNSISKSQSIFETFFQIIQKKYPIGYKKVYDKNLKKNSKDKKEKFYSISTEELEIIIKKINPNCTIPKFTYPSFSNLGNCITNTRGSLRDLYIGAMLASENDNRNPMYQLMKQKNDLLVLFGDTIPELRNKTEAHKHIIIKDEEEYYKTALKIKSDIEEIIKIFLQEI